MQHLNAMHDARRSAMQKAASLSVMLHMCQWRAFASAGGVLKSGPMNDWLPDLAPVLPSASGSRDGIDADGLMFDSFGQLNFDLSADFGSQGNSLNFAPASGRGVTPPANSGAVKPRYEHTQHHQGQQTLQQARPDLALPASPSQAPLQQTMSVSVFTPSISRQPPARQLEQPQWQQVRSLQQSASNFTSECSTLPLQQAPLMKRINATHPQVPSNYDSWAAQGTDMPLPILPPVSAEHLDGVAEVSAVQLMSMLQQSLPPCFTANHAYDGFDVSAIHGPGSAMGPEDNEFLAQGETADCVPGAMASALAREKVLKDNRNAQAKSRAIRAVSQKGKYRAIGAGHAYNSLHGALYNILMVAPCRQESLSWMTS